YLERTGAGSKTDHGRLLGLATGMLQALLLSQRDDGSVAWIGGKTQDLRSTCQMVRFLAACRRRGMAGAGAPLDQAVEWPHPAPRTAGHHAPPRGAWARAAPDP